MITKQFYKFIIITIRFCLPGSESENWRKDMRPPSPRGGGSGGNHARRGGRGGGMRGRGRGGTRGGRGGARIDAESLTGGCSVTVGVRGLLKLVEQGVL